MALVCIWNEVKYIQPSLHFVLVSIRQPGLGKMRRCENLGFVLPQNPD